MAARTVLRRRPWQHLLQCRYASTISTPSPPPPKRRKRPRVRPAVAARRPVKVAGTPQRPPSKSTPRTSAQQQQQQHGMRIAVPCADRLAHAGSSVLVRDFITESLYNPEYGYFCQTNPIYGPSKPIDFSDILNRLEYRNLQAKLYKVCSDSLGEQACPLPY